MYENLPAWKVEPEKEVDPFDEAFGELERLLESVPDELRTVWEKKAAEAAGVAEIDDISEPEEARAARDVVRLLSEKRQEAKMGKGLTEVYVEDPELREQIRENIKESVAIMKRSLDNPANFLGEGNIAHVYISEIEGKTRLCYKSVHNLEEYFTQDEHGNRKNNSIKTETEFLQELSGEIHNGVRVPEPVFYYENSFEGEYILGMEALNAVSLQKVLDGSVELPEAFDLEQFYEKLRTYVREMHDRGIVHNDLYSRNIMVDKETGDPYVIDFGKAQKINFKNDLEDAAKKDYTALTGSYQEMKRYLDDLTNNKNKA